VDTKTRPKRKQNDLIPIGCRKSSSKKKVTAIQSYLKKKKKNHITLHLKLLEKEQTKPKFIRRNEIINFRAEINEIETKKIISMVNETKSWFLEKTIKMYKPLAILIKKKREKTQ